MKKMIDNLRNRFSRVEDQHDAEMPLAMKNYLLIGLGMVVILIGMLLMIGGGSDDPNVFNYEIFSWRRITLAPILIVGGFAFEIYALMKRF